MGRVALEVEPGAWIVGLGQADLRGVYPWMDGVCPAIVAQDLALLDVSRQLEEWDRGRAVAASTDELDAIVAGMTHGQLVSFGTPDREELTQYALGLMRRDR